MEIYAFLIVTALVMPALVATVGTYGLSVWIYQAPPRKRAGGALCLCRDLGGLSSLAARSSGENPKSRVDLDQRGRRDEEAS